MLIRFIDKQQILDAGYWILDENSAALIQHLASSIQHHVILPLNRISKV